MPDPVYVTYFTDPLCSWSWAFEASWRRLLWEFSDRLRYRYRMGQLLADWQRYEDPVNCVSRPAQMAPQWMEVQRTTGVPLNPDLWHENPPTSSIPACTAFKAAERLNPAFAEACLRRLREAAMLDARDISDRDELIAIATETAADFDATDSFQPEVFSDSLDAPESVAALREDVKEARYLEIGRFPTVIFHRRGGRGLALTGYRPYGALQEALGRFAPEVVSLQPPEARSLKLDQLGPYMLRWRRVTLQELAESFGHPAQRIEDEIERLGLSRFVVKASDPTVHAAAADV